MANESSTVHAASEFVESYQPLVATLPSAFVTIGV